VKFSKVSVVGAAIAGLFATAVAVAPSALATAPAWEPDVNGNGGTIAFYNAAGTQVTSGNNLSHLFDYAEASSSEDPTSAFHKASLAFAFPNHSLPTSGWFVNGATVATAYPVASGPSSITSLPATTPVSHPGATDMNLTAALGGGTLDNTAGYANIIQIRMTQSGAGFSYWSADISFDTVAGTWSEVYPAASSAVTTSTALAASPVGHQTGGSSVTLTATVAPSGAVGSVQFKDGATNIGTPVEVSAGTAVRATSTLAAGAHSLTAVFSPTNPGAFAASSSTPLSYAIEDLSSLSTASSKTIKYGTSTTTSTTLKDTRTGLVIPGVAVKLYRRPNTSTSWALVGTVTTSSTGKASKSVAPAARTLYQWRFAGNTAHKAATSGTQTIYVAQVVVIHTTKTTVVHNTTFKIYGTVKPSSSGQTVFLQRLIGTTWTNVASVTLKSQKLPNGITTVGYVFTLKPTAKATLKYRVYKPATSTLVKGYSSSVTITVT
jgi:hypothetical protein